MATQTVDQTQTVRLAPFQEEFLADIFASAKGLTCLLYTSDAADDS